VHLRPDKAVYAYPSEHYKYWRYQLPAANLSYGTFGKNFTTEGLLEEDVKIGDQFRVWVSQNSGYPATDALLQAWS
jgi:MOSC domain-containing protein YiiM